jgi:hypothetical protein
LLEGQFLRDNMWPKKKKKNSRVEGGQDMFAQGKKKE